MKKAVILLLTCIFLLSSFPSTVWAAQSADFGQEFTQYLADAGTQRGSEVTEADVEASLSVYGLSIADFDTVPELSDFLGDIIAPDLSNISTIYEEYGLTEETLNKLLADNGETVSDYIYVNDLSSAVYFYQNPSESDTTGKEDMVNELLPVILDKIDLTEEELTRLKDYFTSLEDYMASEEVQAKYTGLNNRMTELMKAAIAGEKTDEQLTAEMASIYDEFLPLMKLKANITLVKDGAEKEISLADLFAMGNLEKDAVVKIALYSTDSQLLADFSISGDMFEEDVQDITSDVIDTVDSPSKQTYKATTVKGGKLPKTASNDITYASFGLLAAIAGVLMYLWTKNVKGENNKE